MPVTSASSEISAVGDTIDFNMTVGEIWYEVICLGSPWKKSKYIV